MLNEKRFNNYLCSYGGITSFFLFNRQVISINNPIIASKVLKNENCLARQDFPECLLGELNQRLDSIFLLSGDRWVQVKSSTGKISKNRNFKKNHFCT